MTSPLRIRNALLAELDSGDTTLDNITTMCTTPWREPNATNIAAWYRAGLAAAGEPVDWVQWYTERLRSWPNPDAAQSHLTAPSDAAYRAKFEALPHYWRPSSSPGS